MFILTKMVNNTNQYESSQFITKVYHYTLVDLVIKKISKDNLNLENVI